jgi:ferrous iron transport protein A
MPLSMMKIGETLPIKKVKGKDETSKFLSSLGFVEGTDVTVVSFFSGNMILHVKEARVALDQSMVSRIVV